MASGASVLQLLIAFSGLSAKVLTAACDDLPLQVPDTYVDESFLQDIPQQTDIMPATAEKGNEKEEFLQEILQQMAAQLPRVDMSGVKESTVEDLNGDGLPEIYLSALNGYDYHVYYYLDGEMHEVEDLRPWTWTSYLEYTEDGHLLMSAFSHTTGTAGIEQYRIYEWTAQGYHMKEDLWRIPIDWEWEGWEGVPVDFAYFSSEVPIDPSPDDEKGRISQEEYEKKLEDLGHRWTVFADGYYWSETWLSLHHSEDETKIEDEKYGRIQEQILSWHE